MNPSKYKSVSMGIKSWQLATELTKTILPNTTFSRSQVVTFALNRLARSVTTINPNITNEGGFVNNVGELIQLTERESQKRRREKMERLQSKKFPLAVVGTAITHDEIVARNKTIYHHRVLADEKLTLQELGTMFNITRERVRQIQEREVSIKKLNQQQVSKEKTNADSN
jgi:DNA-directed RNA polymerase sigma subunit (sigma70/sigma32)